MSEFKRVGAEVAFGECLVDMEDIEPIHNLVTTELMQAARMPKIEFSADADKLAYSIYCPQPVGDSRENNDRYMTVQLAHESVPDSMRLNLNFRSFFEDQSHSNKRVCYRFETFGRELVQAKKEVFFVFGNSEIRFDENNEPLEDHFVERKMYEKPIVLDDCRTVLDMLARTVRRVRV